MDIPSKGLRLSRTHSALESMLNSSIVSYRIEKALERQT